MCGISGLLINDTALTEENCANLNNSINHMTSTLVPRGPDASGVFVEPPIALGHRRLSILDLTEAGSQPMRLGSDGPILVYNGEIYNFKELRRSLEFLSINEWQGNSDTEVILRVYLQWGLEGLKRLEGIFAFALGIRLRRD